LRDEEGEVESKINAVEFTHGWLPVLGYSRWYLGSHIPTWISTLVTLHFFSRVIQFYQNITVCYLSSGHLQKHLTFITSAT
jgi:hypothetical protein